MATWQFDLQLIPRTEVSRLWANVPTRLTEVQLERIEWWNSFQPPADYDKAIARFLPPADSWSKNIKCWGAEDGNVVEIVMNKGRVVEINVRVDVRALQPDFLEELIGFAKQCDCLILCEDLSIIKPYVSVLLSKIKASAAWRFVANPERFLLSLQKEMRDERRAA